MPRPRARNFIKKYTNDKIILRNLYAVDRKYKYERLQPYQEKNGKKTFLPDARSIRYEKSQIIQELLEKYIFLLDSQLQNRFTENFFILLHRERAISLNYDKILNKKIYDAGNKIIHARRMDTKKIEEVINRFK